MTQLPVSRKMRCASKGYQVNVADWGVAIQAAAAQVLEEFGRVDILVNAASVLSAASMLDLTDEAIDRTLGVNLKSSFYVTRAFLPGMVECNHGHVVTVSSAAGAVGPATLSDGATKWGARGFMESLLQ